jgi:hypothetical protein
MKTDNFMACNINKFHVLSSRTSGENNNAMLPRSLVPLF